MSRIKRANGLDISRGMEGFCRMCIKPYKMVCITGSRAAALGTKHHSTPNTSLLITGSNYRCLDLEPRLTSIKSTSSHHLVATQLSSCYCNHAALWDQLICSGLADAGARVTQGCRETAFLQCRSVPASLRGLRTESV